MIHCLCVGLCFATRSADLRAQTPKEGPSDHQLLSTVPALPPRGGRLRKAGRCPGRMTGAGKRLGRTRRLCVPKSFCSAVWTLDFRRLLLLLLLLAECRCTPGCLSLTPLPLGSPSGSHGRAPPFWAPSIPSWLAVRMQRPERSGRARSPLRPTETTAGITDPRALPELVSQGLPAASGAPPGCR